ncbi:hypothetical protein HK102_009341 [Quaeritorhiza haematococci]|nr:hypothetical protein HK102_009341 [Quaeritorhiza haematococci]
MQGFTPKKQTRIDDSDDFARIRAMSEYGFEFESISSTKIRNPANKAKNENTANRIAMPTTRTLTVTYTYPAIPVTSDVTFERDLPSPSSSSPSTSSTRDALKQLQGALKSIKEEVNDYLSKEVENEKVKGANGNGAAKTAGGAEVDEEGDEDEEDEKDKEDEEDGGVEMKGGVKRSGTGEGKGGESKKVKVGE